MEVWVTGQPHLLYETVELLFAYVNRIPAVELTQEGPYCLPEAAIQQMLDVACAGISQDDPEIQYDFGKYILSEDPERATCVARNLVYNSMEPSGGDLATDCARLCQARQRQRRNRERMVDIDEYRLIYLEPADSRFVPLAQEIAKLGLGPEYAQKLLEQFSGFGEAMDRLETILTPVAEKLRPLLAPWVQLAAPLAWSWEAYFRQPEAEALWRKRVRYQEERPLTSLTVQLRYLRPKLALGAVDGSDDSAFCHMGVAIQMEKTESTNFEPWEFQALRLLGSEARMRMLWAMLDRPMSARELSQRLELHLGGVCRDISNLFHSRLITTEQVNGRNRYRTNQESLCILAKHLTQMEKIQLP